MSLAHFFRLGRTAFFEQYTVLYTAVPVFIIVCAIVFPIVGLYSRQWRYASILDVVSISKAVIAASFIFVFLMFLISRLETIPRSVVAIEMFILMCFLVATRLSFRLEDLKTISWKMKTGKSKRDNIVPVLLVGAGNAGDFYLRALQRDPNCSYLPVGFLDNDPANHRLTLRGIPVLGSFDDFEAVLSELEANGERPRHLIFTDITDGIGDQSMERLVEKAERLGVAVSRLTPPTELRSTGTLGKFELRPIELTDLLQRPQAALDRDAIERLIRGRRVLVTGAGGSIGSELAKQIAALEPAEIVLIESAEFNLYAIELDLNEMKLDVARSGYICNIRDAGRVNEIFDRHRPEIVFHAAALKHVPIVELNPCEGVLTNVIGTMNVADAAKRTNALAMVQISTDKVVNSTGVMGATKRLAELYCQALDIDGIGASGSTRFMTVRFGNVLGSSGSLVPLFKRQIANGGPLTVTHPEMTRFFMTVREAVELTLQASAYGFEMRVGEGEIFVLDMGEPVRIIDIARRMIRLAGYTPDKDMKIKIVGRRPGEKLFEELFDASEKRVQSRIPGVLGAVPNPVPLHTLKTYFSELHGLALSGDIGSLFEIVHTLLPNFRRKVEPENTSEIRFSDAPAGRIAMPNWSPEFTSEKCEPGNPHSEETQMSDHPLPIPATFELQSPTRPAPK